MTPPRRRIIILRASRDTVVLTACTVCLTLALAYAVHQKPPEAGSTAPAPQPWTGQLAEVAAATAAVPTAEPMTSASLTVPKAALALAPMPPAAAPRAGSRPVPCDTQPCQVKAATPPARPKLAQAEPDRVGQRAARAREHERAFALSDLNPLPHLPDAVRKPFSYAGNKIAGLIDWF